MHSPGVPVARGEEQGPVYARAFTVKRRPTGTPLNWPYEYDIALKIGPGGVPIGAERNTPARRILHKIQGPNYMRSGVPIGC